jgi:hypothetical protein
MKRKKKCRALIMNELPFSFSKIKEKKEKNTAAGSTSNNRKNKTTAS